MNSSRTTKPGWILVADASRARLLQQEREGGPVKELRSFEHPASRLHSSALPCGSIRVFAPSPFLGELKAQLGAGTRRLLAGCHDLDLSAAALPAIARRLQQARSQPAPGSTP